MLEIRIRGTAVHIAILHSTETVHMSAMCEKPNRVRRPLDTNVEMENAQIVMCPTQNRALSTAELPFRQSGMRFIPGYTR